VLGIAALAVSYSAAAIRGTGARKNITSGKAEPAVTRDPKTNSFKVLLS
jgi:hypothetical protein